MPARQLIQGFLAGLALLIAGAATAQDTGPEYLDAEVEQQPLSSGFRLLKLPFEEDRENLLHLRTFYQDRGFDGARDQHDWAGGGWLKATGYYWESRLQVSATAYTSQKIWADDDSLSTGALKRDHNSYSALGELYGSITLGRFAAQVGRHEINLPYINKSDIRMTPQTFQGAQALFTPTSDWTIGAGVIDKIKGRTNEDFDPLYKKAGIEEQKENVYVAGSLYESGAGTLAGLYALHAPDYHNGAYLEVSRRWELGEMRYIQLSGQYTRQESTGDELDGDFTVNHYGARITWKHNHLSGSVAYTDYPEEDRLRSPWGSIPGYTSVMIGDFDRPEESAWLLGSTLDFAGVGLNGFSVNAKAVFGDTPDCGELASPDRDEYNVNLKYRQDHGSLAGLVLQLRFAHVDFEDSCEGGDAIDIDEVRFVANFPLTF